MRFFSILCGAISLCGMAHAEAAFQVPKGFDDCHHAVYGRAEKKIAADQIETISEGIVPLTHVGPLRGIQFDTNTSLFTIRHTGTYVINYFLKAHTRNPGTVNARKILAISVQVNNTEKGTLNLDPVEEERFYPFSLWTGNGLIFENLRKGDTVGLTVTKATELAGFFNFYEGEDLPPDTVAYLTIRKAETK